MGSDLETARTVSVLSVEPGAEDRKNLRDIFARSMWTMCPDFEWRLRISASVESAVHEMKHQAIPIVLCEGNSPWKQMLRELVELPDPPLLIVTSRLADDLLWAEALNLGAHDVLAKPFDRNEVVRVMSLAWLKWREKHEQPAVPKKFAAGASSAAGGFGVGSAWDFRNRAGAV